MAITIAQLTAQIKVDATDFVEGMDEAKKSFTSFGNSLRSAGLGMSEFITGPIVAMAGAALKAGMDLDSAYDSIRAKTGATGAALIGLKDDFRGVFGQVTQGAAEVGDALGILHARTGLTGQALQDLGVKTLTLARITDTDTKDAIESTTRAFQKWGVASGDYSGKLDMLLKVQQKTGLNFQTNATQLTNYGATLHQLGYTFDQAAAMMGKWDKEGVKTQFVANALRTGLRNMLKEGIEDPVKAFPLLIQRIKDTGSEGEAAARAIAVFGARGGTDLVDAIKKGYLSVDDFTKLIKKNGETVMKAAKDIDDWPQNIKKLRNEVILTVEPIGTQFFKALNDVMTTMKGPLLSALREVVQWWTSLRPTTQIAIAAFLAVAASIGPVLFVLGQLVISIGAILPIFAAVVTFLVGPWGIAIAGVAAALYMLTVHGARNLTEFINNIKDFFAWMAPFWQREWNGISGVFKAVWKVLDDIVGGAVQTITYVITSFLDLIHGDWTGAWDNIKLAFGRFWESVVDLVANTWPRLRQAIDDIISGIVSLFVGGSKQMKESMENQIKSDASTASGNAADAVKKDPKLQKKWADVGKSHVDAIVSGVKDQAHQSTGQIQGHISNMFANAHKKPKAHKLTEAEKEAKALTSAIQSAKAQLDALSDTADMSTSKLFARFHAIASSSKNDIYKLADLRAEIAMSQQMQNETHKWSSMMEQAKEKVIELKNEGIPTAEALANIFPQMAGTKGGMRMLESLAMELSLKKELTKASEDHRKAVEKENHLSEEANHKLGDLQGEYLRLTHARYEDIAALDLYGKTFDQITDGEHKDRASQIAFWMKTIDAQKELNKSLKDNDTMMTEIGKAIGSMKQKLLGKSEAQEAANSVKVALTPFDKLPSIIKQLEQEDEAQRRWNKTFDELTPKLKAEIIAYLQLAHSVNIKTKADKDQEEQDKRSEALGKRLTDRLAELNEKINHFKTGKDKESNFVTDILAEQLKLTEAQKKMLDEIIAKEKELAPLEKHAKLLDQISTQMKSQFTSLFEGIAKGSKGAFKTMEDGFVQMLQKMAAEYLASQLANLFVGMLSGSMGVGKGALKKRASGGMVQPGETYLIGERGPELFRAPQSGTIIPNNQGSGGGPSVTVNMTVMAQDANSFRYSNQQIAQDLGSAIQRSLQRNG